MAVVIEGVVTSKGREMFAKSFLGATGGFNWTKVKYFKIGEGGWISTGTGRVPKTPDPSKTDIEATGAPGDSYFQKDITSLFVEYVAPSTGKVDCFLNLDEGNDNGFAEAPRYFEIGIFDDYGNMLIYVTFPEETKNDTKTLHHNIVVVF